MNLFGFFAFPIRMDYYTPLYLRPLKLVLFAWLQSLCSNIKCGAVSRATTACNRLCSFKAPDAKWHDALATQSCGTLKSQ